MAERTEIRLAGSADQKLALAEVVSYDALEQAVLARIPKGREDETRRALHLGLEEAQRAVEKKP